MVLVLLLQRVEGVLDAAKLRVYVAGTAVATMRLDVGCEACMQ